MRQPLHLAIITPFPPTISGIAYYGYYISRTLAQSDMFGQITVLTEMAPDTPLDESYSRLRIKRLWRRDTIDAGWKIAAHLWKLRPDIVWYNLGASSFGGSA